MASLFCFCTVVIFEVGTVTGTLEFWLFYLTGDPLTEPFRPLVFEKLTSDTIVVDKFSLFLTGEELPFLALPLMVDCVRFKLLPPCLT